jgi:hypothetical protein
MRQPGLQQLTAAIGSLVRHCGGVRGMLVDEGNGLWCAVPDEPASAELADRFYRTEIAPRARAMQRGQRLSLRGAIGAEHFAGESFASLYVVVVWFLGEFDAIGVRKRILRALPEIETIVLAMPPFDGPGSDGIAQSQRS